METTKEERRPRCTVILLEVKTIENTNSWIRTPPILLWESVFHICFNDLLVQMVKNPSTNARDIRDACSIPGSGGSPGEGTRNPLQYSCLENSMPWTEKPSRLQFVGLRARYVWAPNTHTHTHTHTDVTECRVTWAESKIVEQAQAVHPYVVCVAACSFGHQSLAGELWYTQVRH